MIFMTARFEVKPEEREACMTAIKNFVAAVDETEPGTIAYRSFHDAQNPNRFLHMFAFESAEAEEVHRGSNAVNEFTSILYPRCTQEPSFQRWEPVASMDRRVTREG